MYAVLTVFRYPPNRLFFAFWAMALFRLPLGRNKKVRFSRLMGTGLNGTFDIRPDLRQWAVMAFLEEQPHSQADDTGMEGFHHSLYGTFITGWWKWFGCETWTIVMEVMEGHGTWDGKSLAAAKKRNPAYDGPVAVLTRATIRLTRLRSFWSRVAPVAERFFRSEGVIMSVGIGEMPLIRQATFSIWKNPESMKAFAYRSTEHRDVIERTRKEAWYSEEMFLRFRPVHTYGSIKGVNPCPLD